MITEVLQVDEAVLPRCRHPGAASVGIFCSDVGVFVSLLQVISGADMEIV